MIDPIAYEIAETLTGYQRVPDDIAGDQFPAEINFIQDGKSVPFNGAVYQDKNGSLRLFWMPQGGNYRDEYDALVAWYEVPSMAEIEEMTLDSCALSPCEDTVEPDHPDSWLSLLGLI